MLYTKFKVVYVRGCIVHVFRNMTVHRSTKEDFTYACPIFNKLQWLDKNERVPGEYWRPNDMPYYLFRCKIPTPLSHYNSSSKLIMPWSWLKKQQFCPAPCNPTIDGCNHIDQSRKSGAISSGSLPNMHTLHYSDITSESSSDQGVSSHLVSFR